jgi:hypothetical protein
MAAARKKSKPATKAKKSPKKTAALKKAAPKKAKASTKKKPTLVLVVDRTQPPSPNDPRADALAWFANLSNRIASAGVPELQTLIGEARQYDLVGLSEALGEDSQVLALNKAANELIEAGLESFGAASPQGFQLQVLRDILNDS